MERVKFVDNPVVNEKVAVIIETLRDELINQFRPRSIILTGSFGRGEATAIEESGALRFLSDCEIIIIPYRQIFNRNKVNEFERNFFEKTGLEVEIWGATLSFYLLLPLLSKRMKPTMNNYDLKYGSRLVYGNNYLRKIPNFKPQDIPLWEGIRLLFNRMAESLQHFSLKSPSKEMIFWADKIVLACQDALLLSVGKYHYSYRMKNQLLWELFPQYFGDIVTPRSFPKMAEEAARRKLSGSVDNINPIEYWFEVVEVCDSIFRYVVQKGIGITFEDYTDFQTKYLAAFHSKKAISGNFRNLLRQLMIYGKFPPLEFIFRVKTLWVHVVYSLIPLVYFGLTSNGETNERYLTPVRSSLPPSIMKKGNHNERLGTWEELKECVINLWHQICW